MSSVTHTADQRAALHRILDEDPLNRTTVTEWGGRSIRDVAQSGTRPDVYTLNALARKVEQLDKDYFAHPDNCSLEEHLKERGDFVQKISSLEKDSQRLCIHKANILKKIIWFIRHALGRIGCNRAALLTRLSCIPSKDVTAVIQQKIPNQATVDQLKDSLGNSTCITRCTIGNCAMVTYRNTQEAFPCILLQQPKEENTYEILFLTTNTSYKAMFETATTTTPISWKSMSTESMSHENFKTFMALLDDWLKVSTPPQ